MSETKVAVVNDTTVAEIDAATAASAAEDAKRAADILAAEAKAQAAEGMRDAEQSAEIAAREAEEAKEEVKEVGEWLKEQIAPMMAANLALASRLEMMEKKVTELADSLLSIHQPLTETDQTETPPEQEVKPESESVVAQEEVKEAPPQRKRRVIMI